MARSFRFAPGGGAYPAMSITAGIADIIINEGSETMRFLVILSLIVLLGGCETPAKQPPAPAPIAASKKEPSGPPWLRYRITVAENEWAMRLVRDELKDPDSANFKDLHKVSRGQGDDQICGSVNARNSYGGYGGFKRFMVRADGSVTIASNGFTTNLMSIACDKPPPAPGQ